MFIWDAVSGELLNIYNSMCIFFKSLLPFCNDRNWTLLLSRLWNLHLHLTYHLGEQWDAIVRHPGSSERLRVLLRPIVITKVIMLCWLPAKHYNVLNFYSFFLIHSAEQAIWIITKINHTWHKLSSWDYEVKKDHRGDPQLEPNQCSLSFPVSIYNQVSWRIWDHSECSYR